MIADIAPFDLTKTPTLHAVATNDGQVLAADLQNRLDAALDQAVSQPEVVKASEEYQAAETSLRALQQAARSLNAHVKELREQMAAASGKALDKLIESMASGGTGAGAAGAKPDYARLADLAAIEQRTQLANKAIERLVEHLTPLALIARLRAEAHAHMTRAKAIEAAAQQRAERVLSQLRDAVSDEIVLPVDLSKGVAGALMNHATELKRLAHEAAENADRIERTYIETNREK
jgi:hypothetical protein